MENGPFEDVSPIEDGIFCCRVGLLVWVLLPTEKIPPLFTRFYTSQVVLPDFFHQQYG